MTFCHQLPDLCSDLAADLGIDLGGDLAAGDPDPMHIYRCTMKGFGGKLER